MWIFLPDALSCFINLSVMKVSLLPESKKAWGRTSKSPEATFTLTGTIGIMPVLDWCSWMIALVTAGTVKSDCMEPPRMGAEWLDSEVGPEDWPALLPVTIERCNRVGCEPLQTSHVAFWVHWDFMWSPARHPQHNLCLIRNAIFSLCITLMNFLQTLKECEKPQKGQTFLRVVTFWETAVTPELVDKEGLDTVAAEIDFFLWDAFLTSELTTVLPNTGFLFILVSRSRKVTNFPQVRTPRLSCRMLSAVRAHCSCRKPGSLLTMRRRLCWIVYLPNSISNRHCVAAADEKYCKLVKSFDIILSNRWPSLQSLQVSLC